MNYYFPNCVYKPLNCLSSPILPTYSPLYYSWIDCIKMQNMTSPSFILKMIQTFSIYKVTHGLVLPIFWISFLHTFPTPSPTPILWLHWTQYSLWSLLPKRLRLCSSLCLKYSFLLHFILWVSTYLFDISTSFLRKSLALLTRSISPVIGFYSTNYFPSQHLSQLQFDIYLYKHLINTCLSCWNVNSLRTESVLYLAHVVSSEQDMICWACNK